MSDIPDALADVLTTYTKTIIVLVLLLTVVMAAGMTMVEQESDTEQFETESPAADAQAYIQANFTGGNQENQTIIQLIQRGDNVLSKDSLVRSLEFQQQLRANESINGTLVQSPDAIVGIGNVLANAQLRRQAAMAGQDAGGGTGGDQNQAAGTGEMQQDGTQQTGPTLEQQIAALEALSEAELEALISDVLGENGNPQALALLPASYEPGSTSAKAHNTFIRQRTAGGSVEGPNGFDPTVTRAQLQIKALAQDAETDYTVFGFAIITEEIDQSLGDSIAIVGPLALLFVILALAVGYRDVLDILLGVFGIIVVLVWTFGFMGWTGVNFNQLLISVPVLLIGLSIDYAIHVFMRHREHRLEEGEDRDLRSSMSLALAGVGVALLWVTVTAAIGFLANLVSPIGPLRDFGVVSAFGVFAALFIFGALIPALKIELDSLLEGWGLDRKKRAFGTGNSILSRLLSSGEVAARRFPVAVIAVALLLTLGGAYGATQVDTSFQQEDFLADDPPDWTKSLPGALAPNDYTVKDDLEYIQANFQQEGNDAELLVRGNVTDDRAMYWIAQETDEIAVAETSFRLPNGQADVRTPLSVMRETAVRNPNSSFAASFQAAAGQDGIPEGNLPALYDELLAENPAASEVIYRNEAGEYEALRLVVGLKGDATGSAVTSDMRASADRLEANSDGRLDAVATGDQIVFYEVEQDLFATVIQGLLITLVAVFLFLTIAYRLTGNPASLGIVTLLPVAFAVSWILGSMWLLEIPFNALTGTITSLTIGLGIAYSIHISSRYQLELQRQGDIWDAMHTTVTGTGGALAGSAATTVGGFGTLVFAILPVLQQFGIITGLTIIYAFLASVLVLPSMLVFWTRYVGSVEALGDASASSDEAAPDATTED